MHYKIGKRGHNLLSKLTKGAIVFIILTYILKYIHEKLFETFHLLILVRKNNVTNSSVNYFYRYTYMIFLKFILKKCSNESPSFHTKELELFFKLCILFRWFRLPNLTQF